MSETDARLIPRETPAGSARLFALDVLRGLLMVLMALDHANFFIAHKHSPGEYWGGGFPTYASALPFLTRLVTHLCAPGFFLLMGAGMALFAHSRASLGRSRRAIVGHFLTRGGLLIVLQLLGANAAWALSPGDQGPPIYFGVLFALGGTMIVGSLFLWLRSEVLLALTIVLFIGTELLSPHPGLWEQAFSPLTRLLLVPGGSGPLWVNYPILPWLELVTFGMLLGRWLLEIPPRAYRRAWRVGAAMLVGFVVIRLLNGFGNIRPRTGDTWIDLLNAVKYPPSMAYTLLTSGVNLILLAAFARARCQFRPLLRPFAAFGRTPLFFYILHLFLYAGLGLLLTPGGTSIPAMLPLWALGLLLLYPPCLWYGSLKRRRPARSLLRFF